MDRFKMPMDPTLLSNTKVIRQQKIIEAIWKESAQIKALYCKVGVCTW